MRIEMDIALMVKERNSRTIISGGKDEQKRD